MLNLANKLPTNTKEKKVAKLVEVKQVEVIKGRRLGEPGDKIPISIYKQIAQLCDKCDEVYTHFVDLGTMTRICNHCGFVTKVGETSKTELSNLKIKKKEIPKVNIVYVVDDLFLY